MKTTISILALCLGLGACGDGAPAGPGEGADGGLSGDGATGDGSTGDGTTGDSVCTSDSYWTGGDHESPQMHPGVACIACHTAGVAEEEGEREHGPSFAFAGTVYPTYHEPDDCNGANGGSDEVLVEVTDSTGKTLSAKANSVGNFFLEHATLTPPVTARVTYQGRTRQMATQAPSADCNSCHTESGASSAPGRILLP